jgi:6-phosphogluconolactonase
VAEQVVRHATDDEVADDVAAEVVRELAAVQAARRVPSLVLTGGSIARRFHAAMARLGGDVDWSYVEVWWGDERYLPGTDRERNATQAREDLLSRVPVDPARVHEMPASDEEHADVAAAASAYAHDLRRWVERREPGEPWFDVLMLGIGPDGHCASLFPGRPELAANGYVLPVSDSPKPPPVRITLSLPVLRRARRVLFVATGEGKADAVAASVRGEDVAGTPAAGPRGLSDTTWFVDDAAATALP